MTSPVVNVSLTVILISLFLLSCSRFLPLILILSSSLSLSPTYSLQVVRYSALIGGISYGILHRRTLQAKVDKQAEQHEWDRKVKLIEKAKEAYKDKLVREKAGGDGGEYITVD